MKNKSSIYDKNIFSIGVISQRKNQFGLIRSVEKLNRRTGTDFSVLIAGKIQDISYFEKIQNYIKANGLKNVKMLGLIPPERLIDLYSKMSLFCLVSHQETAPMVISEAMACGKPVIASSLCGIPHMIDHGKTGMVVNQNDINNVSESIGFLLENDEVRIQMGERAKIEARDHWHPKVVAMKTLDAYNEVLHDT